MAYKKKGYPKGESNKASKLTKEKVNVIKNSQEMAKVLAIDFGVHISLIYKIRNNEYWKHI